MHTCKGGYDKADQWVHRGFAGVHLEYMYCVMISWDLNWMTALGIRDGQAWAVTPGPT